MYWRSQPWRQSKCQVDSPRDMKKYSEVELQIYPFLTSALGQSEWYISRPDRFTLGKYPIRLNSSQFFLTLSTERKYLALFGNRTTIPCFSRVTNATVLCRYGLKPFSNRQHFVLYRRFEVTASTSRRLYGQQISPKHWWQPKLQQCSHVSSPN